MSLNNIYLIKEGEPVRLGSYYYEATKESKNELFKTTHTEKATGQELNLGAYPVIKKNQVNKYLRENKSFMIKATIQAWDKEQKELCYSWDEKWDLYLSQTDILQMEESEEETEQRKGCKEFIKKYNFVTSRPLFLASVYELYLFKTWEEMTEQQQRKAQKLSAKLEENRPDWLQIGKADTIKAYEDRIKEGFVYCVFGVSPRTPVNNFIACCGVCRTEKSPGYKQAEKIKDIINSCCYDKNKISIYEVLTMLQKLNITIKRK